MRFAPGSSARLRRQLARAPEPPSRAGQRRKGGAQGARPGLDGGEIEVGAWSYDEVLRTRDFAAMTADEFARARALIREIAVGRPRGAPTGCVPTVAEACWMCRALVRASLATGGDPVTRAYRSRAHGPRKLVLLLDISGSMDAYARALLLYLHAARGSGRGVETFAFGTRLSRLTPELGARDPEAALAAAAKRVVDWSGGTRIGESLKAYNDEWGRRALTRGAVVVVLSDGCERGDGARSPRDGAPRPQAFAVVWVNPLKGHPTTSRWPAACGRRTVRRPAALGARRRKPRSARYSPRRHRTEACSVKEIVDERRALA